MSTSNVPSISWESAGIVIPQESAVLAGVQSDINSAFGGGLNQALSTPQGQLASSESAIIAEKNSEIAYITNQVDPQYASGRFQDAIGRIYFMTREGATSTVVVCTLTGVPSTVIPAGTYAQDTSGNTYACVNSVTIESGGTVSAEFANIETGPVACAAGTLTKVYQTLPGWDAITNPAPGTLGTVVESRTDFEYRRQNSVALNAAGSLPSIYANVFAQSNVTDVYAVQNDNSPSSFVGSILGTTLTVSSMISGRLVTGSVVSGTGIASETFIEAQLTGSPTGGAGTYTVNNSQSISSEAMASPAIAIGVTNYILNANTIYVAVVGGTAANIAQAIYEKKDCGCDTAGNTSAIVTDQSGYNYPYPSYTINYNVPTDIPIYFAVELTNSSTLPSDVVSLVQAAIIARFNGTDGTTRERIGSEIFASRYYGAVSSVATNVSIVSILIGETSSPASTTLEMGIDQHPVISAANIAVTLV